MSSNSNTHSRAEWIYRKYPPLNGLSQLKIKVILLFTAFVALVFVAGSVEVGVSRSFSGEILSSVATKDIKSSGTGIIFQVYKNAGDKVVEDEILAILNFDNKIAKELELVLNDLKVFLSGYGIESPLPQFSKRPFNAPGMSDVESKYKDLLAKYQKCVSSYETKISRTQNEINPLMVKEANFVERIERLKIAKMSPAIKAQIDEARTERDSVKAKIAILRSQIDSEYFDLSQSLISDTKDFSEQLESLIQNREIRAPINGKLGSLKLTKGANIANNQIYASIVPDNSEPVFQSQLSPREAGRLSVGQKIKVRYAAFDWSDATIVALDKVKFSNSIRLKANISKSKTRNPSQEVASAEGLKGEALVNVDNRSILGLLFTRWTDLFHDWKSESTL